MVNPKILLAVGASVLLLSSAIAIFFAAGYTPDSGSRDVRDAPVGTETSTSLLPPPPPPASDQQVPCMGTTGEDCEPTESQPAPRN